MKRLIISLPEDLFRRLRSMATERGISVDALAREAVKAKVEDHRPSPRSLGIGASGKSNTARRSGDEQLEPRPGR